MELETLAGLPPWEYPGGSDAVLLEVLQDRDETPSRRELAAELAGQFAVTTDALARALLELVRDPDEPARLRARAATSLGPILEYLDTGGFEDVLGFEEAPDEHPCREETAWRVRAALPEVYRDPAVPREVRRRVLEASVRAPDPWHTGAVRAAWHDADPAWQLTASFCMAYVPGFEEEILDALEHEDPLVRAHALQAAGSWGIADAEPRVFQILDLPNRNKDLLLAAIDAAADLAEPSDRLHDALVDLAATRDRDVREAASEALERLEGHTAGDEWDLDGGWEAYGDEDVLDRDGED